MDDYIGKLICPQCDGEGVVSLMCPECNQHPDGHVDSAGCPECEGYGWIDIQCITCDGRGIIGGEPHDPTEY